MGKLLQIAACGFLAYFLLIACAIVTVGVVSALAYS